jgi:hypothetical protein
LPPGSLEQKRVAPEPFQVRRHAKISLSADYFALTRAFGTGLFFFGDLVP